MAVVEVACVDVVVWLVAVLIAKSVAAEVVACVEGDEEVKSVRGEAKGVKRKRGLDRRVARPGCGFDFVLE